MISPGTVAVIGLGYVGLPLAHAACDKGWRVIGLETNEQVVDSLLHGISHVEDLSDTDVQGMLARGFLPTADTSTLSEADVIVICVPTPLAADGGPDLSAVVSSGVAVAEHLRRDQLVILESTTYPGTTEEVLVPILETHDLRAGRDFWVAFSPERIDPGNSAFGVRNTPKVLGGLTPQCADRAEEFYASFVENVVRAKGLREAEMTKLLENTYRQVNIALVNEMARFSHLLGIDLWDSIRCASTKPFGFEAFQPGPGVGGHCIPIDPSYLSHRVRTHLGQPFRFVELAQEINGEMPVYVARRAQDILNRVGLAVHGSRVLLVGVTYKANVADLRESPAAELAVTLSSLGAKVAYLDPHVSEWAPSGVRIERKSELSPALNECDLAIFLQHHKSVDVTPVSAASTCILDTRGVLNGPTVEML